MTGSGAEAGCASCPQCGETFRHARAEASDYLVCEGCGLVRMLPFAALNPGSCLLDPLPRPTAV